MADSSFLKLTKVTTDNNILLASCGALCANMFRQILTTSALKKIPRTKP